MSAARDSGGGPIGLAAGGTGGHLFPAQALAEELAARGFATLLLSDERAGRFADDFPGPDIHAIPAATLSLRRPWRLPGQLWTLLAGVRQSLALLRRSRPRVVVGFGGYPSAPPMRAAAILGIPTIVHEQGAALGRANRLAAKRAALIAASFPDITGLPADLAAKVVHTGNPVRRQVLALAGSAYEPPAPDGPFNLLVVGGSQGAHVFAEIIPAMLRALPDETRRRVALVMQCRAEDMEATRAALTGLEIAATLRPFFDDMPQRMTAAHLVICRAGASTIAELAVIGRPAILVPLPHALENDQLHNARKVAEAGGGWLMEQKNITPERLAGFVRRLMEAPEELAVAAAAARRLGKPDAAARLADLAQRLAAGQRRSGSSTA